MSDEEINDYMNVYFEMMLDIASWKKDDTRFTSSWYIKWKETGDIDKRFLTSEMDKKLKNKRYQLNKGNLDQSFLIWRIMKQKQPELNSKFDWLAEAEKCRKGLPPYQPK